MASESDDESVRSSSPHKIVEGAAFLQSIRPSIDRISKADPKNVQETAASQIQLLTAYYSQILGQANRSFVLALSSAAIGLAFFIVAIIFALALQSVVIAAISAGGGVLGEFIAAIIFRLHWKASAQLDKIHNGLELTQRYLLANSLCEGLEGEIKDITRAQLVRTIAGISLGEGETRTHELT
jgi:hypothetical protein